ncbi:FIST N-terminal domain-containing protein [Bradyrhizobium sp. Ash2021]|uniref:FIST N-terminal domain-containing protein n=1 Tax=Bradyrhizobium sp. Ash2021 TaxID=2954771 RepID=UPI00281641E5|nr:FIST N-terminal domain-containing protein [Bradyrhizobium sp. Ash2021]WMT73380.1 FIST C-terminal domain-containing protein [Bradyrhizobium sp. Ash2021]
MSRTDDRFSNSSSVVVAQSKAITATSAVAEIVAQLPSDSLALVLLFVSPWYDPHEFIAEFARFSEHSNVFGCTTAGELAPDGWGDNSVVALGFEARDFVVVARPFSDLANFRVEEGRSLGTELRQELARCAPEIPDQNSFGLLLIDGLCQREEAVMSSIYASLDDIPVVGGSAGDGLRFEKTWVFYDGQAHTDAAVLILLKTSLPFRLFKCDNFEPTSMKMVVTEADIECRVVKEINAEPAAEEYSRAVGLIDTKLDAFSFASHPVLVRVGGAYYARSIQRMNPDGSLSFFCAIDEGMVLTAAKPRNPIGAALDLFAETRDEIGEVSLYLGFECVLRRLDAEQHQFARDMSELYRENRVVGFHGYGEQYRSMHVNQTLTGVAIGKRAQSA